MDTILSLIALPIGLGLLGFVEPCTVGSSLLFLYYLEGRTAAEKLTQTVVFTLARGLFMGVLGMGAVAVGTAFVGYQKAAWLVMGTIYIALGVAYLTGHVERLKRTLGTNLGRLQGARGASAMGLIFAFNIPACAGPLLAALLGTAAVGQTSDYMRGFVMLGLFGLALSLPLVFAVYSTQGRRLLNWVAKFSGKAPKVIGVLFLILGAWSIRFALVAEIL